MPQSLTISRFLRLVPHVVVASLLVNWPAGSAPLTKPPGESTPPPFVPPTPKPPQPKEPKEKEPVSTGEASYFAFRGTLLDGGTFDFAAANALRRVVVYLFSPSESVSEIGTAAAERLHRRRNDYGLTVIGVSMPPRAASETGLLGFRKVWDTTEMEADTRKHLTAVKATFPCILDASAAITERFIGAVRAHLPGSATTLFTFPIRVQGRAGEAVFVGQAKDASDPVGITERTVLKTLGLDVLDDLRPLDADHPPAPNVSFTDTAGETHRLADSRGDVVVFTFIARDCPKCKDQLAGLQQLLKLYGVRNRLQKPWLQVLAITIDTTGERLKQFVQERGYAFPVASDAEGEIRRAFRFLGPVPDTFVIGQDGKVRFHHRSVTPGLNDVLHMEIRSLLGLEPTPFLGGGRFSGDQACRVCHTRQHTDWQLTRHACAWETLVRLGRQDDPECIRCHVVGGTEPGGFVSMLATPHLADVQCEACHGANGCKAFTKKPTEPVKAETCQACHDAKHSPRFDFATARPRVLHDRAEQLAKLSPADRDAQMRKLCQGADRELFDKDIPYVGSAACARCHPTESAVLRDDPLHGKAFAKLEKPPPDAPGAPRHIRGVVGIGKPECLRCHTTGYARPGGYPAVAQAPGGTGLRPVSPAMGEVGCEACHGPGKSHCDDPKKPRAIARLGGTCNECNVLPICRACHDDDNDPSFDYKSALPKTRHRVGKAITP